MSVDGSEITRARRIVVKVGSALVVDAQAGVPDRAWLAAFAADAARLRARGQQVLVVSSGAVALGRRRLGLSRRKLTLPDILPEDLTHVNGIELFSRRGPKRRHQNKH